jgi:transcriptional regulator with XRE-family HTH domain
MDLIRIGEKLISRAKIDRVIDQVLELRAGGWSQQEVAHRLSIDRTFVSRLEKLGEIRKGRRIAAIGFPIKNKGEIVATLEELGVDFHLIMSETERWQFVKEKTGIELFNVLMDLLARFRSYDVVLIIGSNKRVKLIESLLDKETVAIEIGQSPIEGDRDVDPVMVREIVLSAREPKQQEVNN